ncbi:gas vesicle protein [Natrarchaeobius halalkaliphilus]|uniref:Gas vesicle protein n=1 Tax=Natrarchaeobius halalkaliphilus TaxID=1679091 RepID=A0A3N6LP49_9EURY|nr:gas vesicle protein [Natrarchaeobius halalkaliphilus]RQG89857.1 gas vesicle protein [Natrarchaeobius halalkaliphilus]
MVDDFQPSRQKTDLAEVVEMLLDKGIVINADIAVSIGDTQLLGVQVRAAIASFETAAKYGLEFPEGTDMRRVAEAVDDPEILEQERPNPAIDPTRGVNVSPDKRSDDERAEADEGGDENADQRANSRFERSDRGTERVGARPDPDRPTGGGFDMVGEDTETGHDGGDGGDESNAGDDAAAAKTEGS